MATHPINCDNKNSTKGMLQYEESTDLFWHDISTISDHEINQKNKKGQTLLHIQCLKGASLEIVKLLIRKGASLVALDNENRTPLHCVIDSRGINRIKILKLLFQYGAKTDIHPNNDAFIYAVLKRDIESVKEMHNYEPSVIKYFKEKLETLDQFACKFRCLIGDESLRMFQFLLTQCKENITRSLSKVLHYDHTDSKAFDKNPKGNGFHLACRLGCYDTIIFMIEAELFSHEDIDKKDSNGETFVELLKATQLPESLKSELEAKIEGKHQSDIEKENNPQLRALYRTQYSLRTLIKSLERSKAPEEISSIATQLHRVEADFNQNILHSQELKELHKELHKASSSKPESEELGSIANRLECIENQMAKVANSSKDILKINNEMKALVKNEQKHNENMDTKMTDISKMLLKCQISQNLQYSAQPQYQLNTFITALQRKYQRC